MKILLTGATGLLGATIMEAFARTPHQAVGASHSTDRGGMTRLELTSRDSVRSTLLGRNYTHVIHCAALRSPDYCLAHQDEACRVNILGTEYIAEAAREAGAKVVYISTDYVFDGTNPPYEADDPPRPINLYGRTKLAGEYAARTLSGALIVRIPALYKLDPEEPRNVLSQFVGWLRAGETRPQDSETVRYYTLVEDIAAALVFLLEQDIDGIVQLSAEEKTSKAKFARDIATALGFDPALAPDAPPPTTGDIRPHDSHLSIARYQDLGGPRFRGIQEALAQLRP